MLLASTREGLANADTWKVLTKIQVSKSILQLAATNCVIWYMVVVYDAFHSKKGYALLMRTILMYYVAVTINSIINVKLINYFPVVM